VSYRYSPRDPQCPASPIAVIIVDDGDLPPLNSDTAPGGRDARRLAFCLRQFVHMIYIFDALDDVARKIEELSSVGIDCVLLIDGTFHEGLVCDASAARRELKRRLGERGFNLRCVPSIAISWSSDQDRIERMQLSGFSAFVQKCELRNANGLFVALAHVLYQRGLHADWMVFFLKLKLAQDGNGRSVFMNPSEGKREDKCVLFDRPAPPSNRFFGLFRGQG
jgi:hypothetical protein